MPWYITDGVLQRSDTAPSESSILTDISVEGDVIIPNGVTVIAQGAFMGLVHMTSITLPSSLITIEDWAFVACVSLTTLSLPERLTSIGECAFFECSGLTSVSLPDSLTHIGDFAFSACKKLLTFHIAPSHPTLYCENNLLISKEGTLLWANPVQKYITLPDGITSIGEWALSGADFVGITLPDSLTHIDCAVFSSCQRLKTICVSPSHPTLYSKNKLLISRDNVLLWASLTLRRVTLPNILTDIEPSVFPPHSCLTSIGISGQLLKKTYKHFIDQLKDHLKEIRCTANVDKVPTRLLPIVLTTFAKCEQKYSKGLRAEHIALLKKKAAALIQTACGCQELLHLMCREKLIQAKDIDAFISTAARIGNPEATAMLLNYQANVLTMEAVFKARQRKEKALERQEDKIIRRIEARADKVGIDGLNFVVTGKLKNFAKREDIKAYITALGGKLLPSMSANTDYLITNDTDTDSTKSVKAAELGIVILTEDEFLKMAERTK